jgi:NAD(P)-dependent dehydrogenase (short-subunit alcohol dehydrogenase family)
MNLLEGKVILITGAGGGVGRAHALLFARLGAKLVINDLGGDVRGEGASPTSADQVVQEINASGGHSIANYEDISDWEGARRAVQSGIDAFGTLDGLVNNAGILRKQELADLTESDFDSLVRVHMKGAFACSKHACHYWRERHRTGAKANASIVNTISDALLVSLPSYTVYGAAKAAIAHLTTCGSREAMEYGVRINAYGPRARTRMTSPRRPDTGTESSSADDIRSPGNSSPLVAWLLSDEADHVSGQVFQTIGGGIAPCTPWRAGTVIWPPNGEVRFAPEAIGPILNAQVFGSRFPNLMPMEPPGWSVDITKK